jgi:transcriptional regulator with PAS, ATPase and Fis domain
LRTSWAGPEEGQVLDYRMIEGGELGVANMQITNIRVGEAMTSEYGAVLPDTTLEEAVNVLLQNHWEEVLVLDDRKRLHGLVTKESLMRSLSNGVSPSLPIREVCQRDIITTGWDEELARARDVMRWYKIGRLPVVAPGGDVLGLLTAKDVCNGFAGKLETMGHHMYAVMENIAEAIRVIDCSGIVSFWNRGAEKLFQIKESEIVGKPLAEFFPDDALLNIIYTGKPQRNLVCELGDWLVVHNMVPVVTEDEEIIGAVCTTQDMTLVKSYLDQLEETTGRVKRLERRVSGGEEEPFYTVHQYTKRILEKAKKVAATEATVLIQGESGTGKEVLADVVYRHSRRNHQPFVEINCSAVPESLFESEMFGYAPGTFTGARKDGKPGKFELADEGTLFLDEIGELSLDMQAKLLRVIQEGKFYRVGGTKPVEVDVRIIAATNRELARLVEEGEFREDLFYRLNVINFVLPPLRERKEDIPGLVNRFIMELSCEYGLQVRGTDPRALKALIGYDWPGNVRQLRNVLERVLILMEGDTITLKSLSEAAVLDSLQSEDVRSEEAARQPEQEVAEDGLEDYMVKTEKEIIIKALEDCNYNKARAAQLLGIPRSTLYYKIKTLDIPDARGSAI